MSTAITLAEPTNALALLVADTGLDATKAAVITERFADYEAKAAEWATKAAALTVTDESQKAEMKMAREGRLFMRQLRLTVESTRKELKDDYLQGGRAVDAVAKHLIGLIQPTEKYLEEQEGFAVRAAAERKEALRATRYAALAEYTADPNVYALAELTEEAYMELLNGLFAAREAKQEAARKQAEADRLADEEAEIARAADAAERIRVRAENERLQAEAAQREAAMKAEREAAEQARLKAEWDAAELRLAAEKKAAADKAAADALLRQEREAAEELRKGIAAQKEREAQAEKVRKNEADSMERERLAAAKKAAAAPDRDKLLALAAVLNAVTLPLLATPEAQQIMADVQGLMGKVNAYILKKADEL